MHDLTSSLSRLAKFFGVLAACCLTAGCEVPQPRGGGRLTWIVESTTRRPYWLYTPKDYVEFFSSTRHTRRWPLVVSFHGMNPWDTANAQAREWQQEADRYGLIVCAPELATCNSLMEYPIRKLHSYVKADERAIVAIMDDVFRRTNADPNRVLSTSWSAGGSIAHYIVNRYPQRFSCIAVRQSNFSPMIMDSEKADLYADMTVAVFYTQNDFQACRKESEAAVEWYRQHGFENVQRGVFSSMGHERTPETAAAVFAKACGLNAKTPPVTLARMHLMDDTGLPSPVSPSTAPPGSPPITLR
jgi:poly(3-hydroxybutyrate) depolymerase